MENNDLGQRRDQQIAAAGNAASKAAATIPTTATVATVATTSLRFSLSRSICSVCRDVFYWIGKTSIALKLGLLHQLSR
jgi:hypothetical protein